MADGILITKINKSDFIWQTRLDHTAYEESCFNKLFQKSWKTAEKKGVLNYSVQDIYTKILPGDYRIITQLNPMRNKKRRTPVPISSIKQPFDPTKFNFNMIKKDEILFEIVINKSLMENSKEKEILEEDGLTSIIIVNTAPVTPFHCLIVPSPRNFRPQVLDWEGLLLGISLILASNTPALKVGFNSLGGMASVNHYHLHAYYLPHPIAIETAVCQRFAGPVYTFKNHYAPGFIFQLENEDIGGLVRDSQTLIDFLLNEQICHNVVITRGIRSQVAGSESSNYDTVRVCIWARKSNYGVKQVEGFATALCELAGHLPVYDEETWENVTEQDVKKAMQDVCLQTYTDLLPKIQRLFSYQSNLHHI